MSGHLDAKGVDSGLGIRVTAAHASENPYELLRRVHADVVVKNLPPHLKDADEIVSEEKIGRQRRCAVDH